MNYNSIIWFSLLSKEQIASNNMQISTGGNSVHQRGKAEGGRKCECCFYTATMGFSVPGMQGEATHNGHLSTLSAEETQRACVSIKLDDLP